MVHLSQMQAKDEVDLLGPTTTDCRCSTILRTRTAQIEQLNSPRSICFRPKLAGTVKQ